MYIRQHNLQDPSDRRYILCDQALGRIFGNKTKRVNCFKMNQFLNKHLARPGEELPSIKTNFRAENDHNQMEEDVSIAKSESILVPESLKNLGISGIQQCTSYNDLLQIILRHLASQYGSDPHVYINSDDALTVLLGGSGPFSVMDVLQAVTDAFPVHQ